MFSPVTISVYLTRQSLKLGSRTTFFFKCLVMMVWLVVLWFPNPLCLILAHVSSMYHPLILKFLTWIFLDGSSQIISDIRDIIILIIIQLQPPIPIFILSLWFSLYPFFFWLENSFDKFSYNMRRNFNWALFVGSGIPIRSKVCTKIFRALEKK